MSSSKVKPRRHSLPSLESVKSVEKGTSAGKENSTTPVQTERKRKRLLNDSETVAPSKKPAISIPNVTGGLQGALGKELFEDSLCCLPGGVYGVEEGGGVGEVQSGRGGGISAYTWRISLCMLKMMDRKFTVWASVRFTLS